MSSDTHNQLVVDSMTPGEPEPDPASDWSGLSDEDQNKLARFDLLEMDTRFATRRLCLFLQRYTGQIPVEATDYIQQILDELLIRHLLAKDRASAEGKGQP